MEVGPTKITFRTILTIASRDWGRLLSSFYWNYSGFDAAGAYAGEIKSPRTTYPQAMMLIVLRLLSLVYQNVCRIDGSTLPSGNVIPFLAISGVDKPHYTEWTDELLHCTHIS